MSERYTVAHLDNRLFADFDRFMKSNKIRPPQEIKHGQWIHDVVILESHLNEIMHLLERGSRLWQHFQECGEVSFGW